MENEIKQKLDQLAEFQAERDVTMLEKQRLLDELYTAEIKARMAEIEEEFSGKIEAVNEKIAALEAEIKKDVIEHGASVKSSTLHAVFSKGRVSWDTKSLDGYAAAHPELLAFRREGEPSVSIRVVKEK
jgi:phage host-nuclease inhibitor protein Gam